MGRPPLRKEQKRAMMQSLITAAEDIILTEGIESATIRGVANKVGVNSAVLYRFFKDRNELLVFASLNYFKNYCVKLSEKLRSTDAVRTESGIYYLTWEIFCEYGFQEPQMTELLFFSEYSAQLPQIIKVYMDLFPEVLKGLDGDVRNMLTMGTLKKRNLEVLRPLLTGKTGQENIENINELSVGYFCYMLENTGETLSVEEKKDRMMKTLHYLTDFYLA